MCLVRECWTGLHEMGYGLAFEFTYIDKDTYSASAKDIEMAPPLYVNREAGDLESEKAVSSKPVSFGYQSPMLMVFLRYMVCSDLLRYLFGRQEYLSSQHQSLVYNDYHEGIVDCEFLKKEFQLPPIHRTLSKLAGALVFQSVGSIEPFENPSDTRKLESSSYHALGACLRPYNAFLRR
ncbi:hypothetical protein Tco_0417965 [Tanacetum coccineum]